MADVLLVFCPQHAQIAVQISHELQKAGVESVELATNIKAGLRRLNKLFDVVVVDAALADSADDPVADDGGLAFCKKFRASSNTPLVLLAPQVTPKLIMACVAIPAPAAVPVNDTNTVAVTAIELMRRTTTPERRLEITITADDTGWHYTMRGVGFDYSKKGALNVSKSAWMCWTDLHYSPDHWYIDFAKVGNSIRTCFCEENTNFENDRETGIARAKLQAESREREFDTLEVETSVAFVVSKTYYRLVLEAIFNPGWPEPWLARAPMVRRISGNNSGRGELFETAASNLRALVICADTSGVFHSNEVPGGKVKLSRLDNVVDECNEVVERLSRSDGLTGRTWFQKTNIYRFGAGGEPLTESRLLTKLKEGPWDLIHFAGHSYFSAPPNDHDLGSGYLFIGKPDEPEAIKFSFLAGFLRSARFVYLSSCESGNSSFAVEATAAGIHTVVGYRWRVADWAADLQARLFYRELLRHRSVNTAFWNARRQMYRHFKGKQDTWASAMLVTSDNN